ncbi:electron transport complex subunit G [Thiosulfatimonas sediminis]|uniref:Ion-translocating oxidoreductase complex subunit G n=1 Tax=Thiosulfatimonas sediminis TaxID=2675054 RepID=A0A6F8PVP7_9GAMM|nr:electron transport complex subunit RsxG [Thiosulfatimonas sediminis]BBP46078.1 electron transport complex subunit G [Thiosulfatimonas sediminis]
MSQKPMFNSELVKAMSSSAGKLSGFVVLCIILLLTVRGLTAPQIVAAEKQKLLDGFNQVLPASRYDNDPLQDQLHLKDPEQLALLGAKTWVTVYRARNAGQPAGAIFQTIAPNGYSGNIVILVGVFPNGEISGVRVLKHAETPGLGDKIELNKNPWILSFNGRTLDASNLSIWAVKKDGGEFDQFTGATITPRAVVGAVQKALQVVNQMGERLYEESQ